MGNKQIIITNSFAYSFVLSLYLLVPSINKIFYAYFPLFQYSIMSILYLTIGILLICFFCRSSGIKGLSKSNIIIIGVIFIFFIFSLVQNKTKINILEFAVYFVFPLLFFSFKKIDLNVFLKTSLIVGAFGLPYVNKIFVLDYNGAAEMGTSYAFLLPAIVPIYYLFRHNRKTFLFIVLSIFNLIYDVEIVMHGSRGCILSIFIFVLLLFIFCFGNKNSETKIRKRLLVIFALVIIILINLSSIISFLVSGLASLGLSANFLNKIIFLIQNGDITNGRSEIYQMAFNGFLNKPIFGNGYDSFDYYTGLEYPHNFLLQLLFDLGLFGLLLILVPFVIGTYRIIKRANRDSAYFFLIIFSSSVPGALFSQNAWKNVLLWMTISATCSMLSYRKVTIKNDKKIIKEILVS